MKKILYILVLLIFTYSCVSKTTTSKEAISIDYTLEEIVSDQRRDDVGMGSEEPHMEDLTTSTGEDVSNGMKDVEILLSGTYKPLGTLVYKVDSVLTIGVVSRVEARIIKQVSDETTEQLISLTAHTSTGIIYEEIIEVGNIMDMELKSLELDAFTINKITDDEQLVDENDITFWLWSVTANKVGDYNLIMTAKIKDYGPSRNVIIFDKQISVMNKPKKKYTIIFTPPDNIKRYNEIEIELDLVEMNPYVYNFEWGGEGEVVINFDGNVIVTSDENIINDNKTAFHYKWIIKPEGKEKVIPFNIKIIGDYEDLIILDGNLIVEKNIKESFNRFIDGAVKRWYWLFTALLIPLIGFIRKKYFKKKD